MANSPVEKLLSENPKLLELDPPFRGYYPYHSLRNQLKNKLECFLNEEAPYVDSMELFLMIKKYRENTHVLFIKVVSGSLKKQIQIMLVK